MLEKVRFTERNTINNLVVDGEDVTWGPNIGESISIKAANGKIMSGKITEVLHDWINKELVITIN